MDNTDNNITIRNGDFFLKADLEILAGVKTVTEKHRFPDHKGALTSEVTVFSGLLPIPLTKWKTLMRLMFEAADENRDGIDSLCSQLDDLQKMTQTKWREASKAYQLEWKAKPPYCYRAELKAIEQKNRKLTTDVKRSKETYDRVTKMIQYYNEAREKAKEKGWI